MTKKEKRSSEILAGENRKFFGKKVKMWNFSTESEILFGNTRKISNRGKCIIASGGMDAPGAVWDNMWCGKVEFYRDQYKVLSGREDSQ